LSPALPPVQVRPEPLDEGDFLLIRQAAVHRRAVRSAARTALASSTTTLSVGVLAVPLVFFWPSWEGALVAVGLCIIGWVEYRGCRRMRRADPSAARVLGRNQLALLGLIVLYCVVQMATFSPEKAKAVAVSPEVRSQLAALPNMEKAIDGAVERLAPLVTYGLYGLVIVLSAIFQGGLAAYYFTRRRHLEAFNSRTPQWVRRLFIEAGA
jgi:type IV secretory pathway TrbD component